MRKRLTKQGMGLNDSPTTLHVKEPNPPVEKYETGNPSSWAEDVNMDKPWDEENAAGREPSGHPKMKSYANMVKEAKDLEAKALRCLKMAETILGEAPADVVERQAVDFMSMSNKSVLSTLRRMREFEENISETRIAKVVDAVLEVIAEDEKEKEEEKEEKVAEEKEEEEKEEKVAEEKEEEEEKKEATDEEEEEEKKEAAVDKAAEEDKIATIIEAVLEVLAEEKVEEKDEEKIEEKVAEKEEEEEEKVEEKEAAKEEKDEEKIEEKVAEKEEEEEEKVEEKEAAKEEKEEEYKVEEKQALDVSFDDIGDVMASREDVAALSQLFSAGDEEEEEEKETKKEAKITTLKNVTASKSNDEISKLSSLWHKEY